MTLKKAFLLFLVFPCAALAELNISSLLDVLPGGRYVPPIGSEMIYDDERPTTQFESPNRGRTKAVFPKYELTLINDSASIAIVSANSPTQNLEDCQSKLGDTSEVLSKKFGGYARTSAAESQLGGSNEYSKVGQDIYYILECSKKYGPFWMLHFQMRSKAQDKFLKAAWEEYLESRS
ncbi:MAG: hypothetical protein AB8C02_15555 [Halioglobus sp.]